MWGFPLVTDRRFAIGYWEDGQMRLGTTRYASPAGALRSLQRRKYQGRADVLMRLPETLLGPRWERVATFDMT